MNKIIRKIITKKTKCYFVSPHVDDAVLSSGNLIYTIAKKTKVVIVNIFTRGGRLNTLSARVTLKRARMKDSDEYYKRRLDEEKNVIEKLGAESINFGYQEALWRLKNKKTKFGIFSRIIPEMQHIYPTFSLHIISGKISKHDLKLIDEIATRLSFIEKDSYIFCPMGTGNHVDHLIVRYACEKLKTKKFFWSDFPYNITSKDNFNGFKKLIFHTKQNRKEKLIRLYKSQFDLMFPENRIPVIDEKFFYKDV